jgi:hypothetical protein
MKPKGPLVTLAAGAVLAAGLLIANFSFSQAEQDAATTTAASSAPAVSPSVSPPASPSPSSPAASPPAVATTAAVSPAAPVTSAGRVNGGGSLSVVVKGATAVAYLCDGRNEAWLRGSVNGSALSLNNAKGDTLTATRGGGKLTGSVTVQGTTWTFTLPTVKKPSGLYRATAKVRGATIVAGWVVLPDGSQAGAWTADGGSVTPAPPIDLGSGATTVDGAPMTAAPLDPGTTTPAS